MDISAYQHMNIRMSTRGKRPLRNLTPSDKVRAITRIHNGETKASVSRDIGVPESTLRGWCKNEQKLRFMCRQLGAVDHINFMSGIENPSEKRIRFNNYIQSPKIAPAANDFMYSRLPLNGLPFSSNGNNTILDKITFNDLIKKHIVSENVVKQPFASFNNHAIASIANLSIPDYSQLPVVQNLNLLSLLCPNSEDLIDTYSLDRIKVITPLPVQNSTADDTNDISKITANNSNSSNNIIADSLAVCNWAKEFTNSVSNANTGIECIKKKVHNLNTVLKDNLNSVSKPSSEDSSHLAFVELCQISNLSESESSMLEWCKVFNASLNFMALVAAAATLHPNTSENATTSKKDTIRPMDNLFYQEFRKIAVTVDPLPNSVVVANGDLSSDSYFESEPEDLSVRSATTSKLSSSFNSRSQNPVKSLGSYSPVQNNIDQ